MQVRYRCDPCCVLYAGMFNVSALSEVLTGDDSVFISDLEVFVMMTNEWKDMREAFRDRDIITDNLNTRFFEPATDADRKRGFALH